MYTVNIHLHRIQFYFEKIIEENICS